MEDPSASLLRPRRSKPRSTLSKVAGIFGATLGLALLSAAAIVLPALFSSSADPKQTVLTAVLPGRAGRIMSAAQSLESDHSAAPKQTLYHGVVYPPNYYGHYDHFGHYGHYDNGMYYYKHPHAVHHVDVDGGTIGIGHHGQTWFVSHEGPAEQASGCTSECDTAQSRLMTAAEGMMQAAALNDLKRKEAAAEQGEITKTWASKMRAALDILDPLPPPPSPPAGICHTTVECAHCHAIKDEEGCTEARGLWEAKGDWRGDIHAEEEEVNKQMKGRMDEAVDLAKQIPV